MPRIMKEAEERKQEILDTAMKLFYEKGYEQTSISDIAQTMQVAQGLCYRYFPSKEALFETAIDHYAQSWIDNMTAVVIENRKTLREIIDDMPAFMDTNDNFYYALCYDVKSKKLQDQLAMKICEKFLPAVKKQLDAANSRGEIQILDTETAASFAVYGQLGVLLRSDLSGREKIERIGSFLYYMMHL